MFWYAGYYVSIIFVTQTRLPVICLVIELISKGIFFKDAPTILRAKESKFATYIMCVFLIKSSKRKEAK